MIKNILLIFIILLLIDVIWLYLIKDKYAKQIVKIQKQEVVVNYYSALFVYVLLAIGIYYLSINKTDIMTKVKLSALFGLITYGVYDFTNGAIFKDWDFKLAIMDTMWGSILCASSMYAYSQIYS
jgi:uncharacterized membrane protein